jgi:hypothetical protein
LLLASGDRLLGLALSLKHSIHGLFNHVRWSGTGVFSDHVVTPAQQCSIAFESVQFLILREANRRGQ